MKIFKLICLVVSVGLFDNSVVAASETWYGELAQGGIIQGQLKDVEKVQINNRDFMVGKNGNVLIAFERDEKETLEARLFYANGNSEIKTLKIMPTKWDIQKINGIPQKKVTPPKEDLSAIEDERKQVREAVAVISDSEWWQNGFMQPVKGRISGKFGGQRIMNGQKMNPHNGMDIAAPVGTPVVAAGDGKVVLTAKNLFYTGNVVIISHGYGLQTIYAHLNSIGVENGQVVKKGDEIGKVGKTGRVSGPHLHWGATLKGLRFNPFTLLKLNKSDDAKQIKFEDFTK